MLLRYVSKFRLYQKCKHQMIEQSETMEDALLRSSGKASSSNIECSSAYSASMVLEYPSLTLQS